MKKHPSIHFWKWNQESRSLRYLW